MYAVAKQLDSVEFYDESVEGISLNECISNAIAMVQEPRY
jgi:hypothetical protein